MCLTYLFLVLVKLTIHKPYVLRQLKPSNVALNDHSVLTELKYHNYGCKIICNNNAFRLIALF